MNRYSYQYFEYIQRLFWKDIFHCGTKAWCQCSNNNGQVFVQGYLIYDAPPPQPSLFAFMRKNIPMTTTNKSRNMKKVTKIEAYKVQAFSLSQ